MSENQVIAAIMFGASLFFSLITIAIAIDNPKNRVILLEALAAGVFLTLGIYYLLFK